MKTQLLILSVTAAAIVSAASSAQACNGCNNGWGYDYGYLYNSLDYNVPYFAAHPPVYYSYPVPRTYGYSPFAYPPYVMTPDVVSESAPLQITNPYVPSSTQEQSKAPVDKAASAESQPQPLVIINPYVTNQKTIAQSER